MVKEHLDVEKVMKNYLRVALSIFNVLKKNKIWKAWEKDKIQQTKLGWNLLFLQQWWNNKWGDETRMQVIKQDMIW